MSLFLPLIHDTPPWRPHWTGLQFASFNQSHSLILSSIHPSIHLSTTSCLLTPTHTFLPQICTSYHISSPPPHLLLFYCITVYPCIWSMFNRRQQSSRVSTVSTVSRVSSPECSSSSSSSIWSLTLDDLWLVIQLTHMKMKIWQMIWTGGNLDMSQFWPRSRTLGMPGIYGWGLCSIPPSVKVKD